MASLDAVLTISQPAVDVSRPAALPGLGHRSMSEAVLGIPIGQFFLVARVGLVGSWLALNRWVRRS